MIQNLFFFLYACDLSLSVSKFGAYVEPAKQKIHVNTCEHSVVCFTGKVK